MVAIAALAVFCVVQDRVTADGVRRYVTAQRAAAAGQRPPVTIDEVMRPAVRNSFERALWSSGGVAAAGLAVVALTEWRRRRG